MPSSRRSLVLIGLLLLVFNILLWGLFFQAERASLLITTATTILTTSLQDNIPAHCESIKTEKQCLADKFCHPLVGMMCGGSQTVFFGCYERELKKEVKPTHSCYQQDKRSIFWFHDLYLKTLPNGWEEDSNCEKCFKKKPTIAILVLVWNEMESLIHTLKTWKQGGLLNFVDERIIYIQELSPEKIEAVKPYNFTILGSEENTNLAFALDTLIEKSSSEYVLFLEKDWALVEPFFHVKQQIEGAMKLISEGRADQVKLRSRFNGGWPNYAVSFFQGKEDIVYEQQPNLLCNFYHWVKNPEVKYPDKFRVCSAEPLFYCIDSYYCNWTNNPILFKKKWWKQYFSNLARAMDRDHVHNWEGHLNNDWSVWNERGFTVAEGNGLFSHREINEE